MAASADTCVRIEANGANRDVIYVKSTWFPTHFSLSITDGLHAWICDGSEKNVADRASQWDQSVSEYLEDAQRYLSYQQPGSAYTIKDAGNGSIRLSWTLEKQGTKLEWRWKCDKAPNEQKVISDILDFLMDANTRLSEEVVRKTRSFDRMKVEAEKCLAQSEKFKNEKAEFETTIFAKFVAVLNSKKAKLRELREKCLHSEPAKKNVREDASDFSEEETDMESDQNDNEESSAGPTHSDSKDSEGAEINKKPLKSTGGVSPAPSNKATENRLEKQNSTDEKKNITSEPTDPDATQVLGDAEISKDSDHGEPSASAAGLLAVSEYTSAPKKRRRL
uniref:DNA repair protein XRCC4 n=1 Tax=Picea sitchensis TaxID=3332 RepID=D5AA21_PICSI|nr:unknown [Picea sitchensis]